MNLMKEIEALLKFSKSLYAPAPPKKSQNSSATFNSFSKSNIPAIIQRLYGLGSYGLYGIAIKVFTFAFGFSAKTIAVHSKKSSFKLLKSAFIWFSCFNIS